MLNFRQVHFVLLDKLVSAMGLKICVSHFLSFFLVLFSYFILTFFSLFTVDVTRSLQRSSLSARRSTSASEVRLDEKVLHCSWHPVNNTIAVAGHAGLCLYKV